MNPIANILNFIKSTDKETLAFIFGFFPLLVTIIPLYCYNKRIWKDRLDKLQPDIEQLRIEIGGIKNELYSIKSNKDEHDKFLEKIEKMQEVIWSTSGTINSLSNDVKSHSEKIGNLTMKVVFLSATLKSKDVVEEICHDEIDEREENHV